MVPSNCPYAFSYVCADLLSMSISFDKNYIRSCSGGRQYGCRGVHAGATSARNACCKLDKERVELQYGWQNDYPALI